MASFVGVAGAEVGAGVPVRVDRWFWGEGIAPLVWLDPTYLQGGDDGGLCGTEPLTPEARWVVVAWRFEGRLTVDMCAPHALADEPSGRQMLAELTAAFGPGTPVAQPPPADDFATVEPMLPMITTLLTITAATLAISAAALAVFARRGRAR